MSKRVKFNQKNQTPQNTGPHKPEHLTKKTRKLSKIDLKPKSELKAHFSQRVWPLVDETHGGRHKI